MFIMKKTLLIFAVIILIFAGCSNSEAQKESKKSSNEKQTETQTIKKMPEFELKNIDGETVSSDDFDNKVLLVDFWATWCPPCRKEIPGFINLYEKYKDKGVEIIGISLDKDMDKLESFVDENKINYTVLIGNKEIADAFGGIQGIPTTFIIDRNGNVEFKQVGLASEKKFEEELKKVLNK